MKYDTSRAELYNEADDRPEKHDVAASHPEIAARLSKLVLDWKATLPTSPPAGCMSSDMSAKAEGKQERRRK